MKKFSNTVDPGSDPFTYCCLDWCPPGEAPKEPKLKLPEIYWTKDLLPICDCKILRWISNCAKNDSNCLQLTCSESNCDKLCKSQGFDGRSDSIDGCYAHDNETDTDTKSLYCVCLLKMEPEPIYSELTELVEVIEPFSTSENVSIVADSLITSGSSCDARKFILDFSLMFVIGITLLHLCYAW